MTLSFDGIVSGLVAQGIPRERAESVARREIGVPVVTEAEQRRADALEKAEQTEIAKLFRAFGFDVFSLSQARASKQTPGLPDLWCMHRARPIAFWWESKRTTGGRFSEAQIQFRDAAIRCGVGYGSGDRRAAQQHVVALGLAYVTAIGTLEPVR